MGYYSTMRGGFEIVPPLDHAEILRILENPVREGHPDGDDSHIFIGRWAPFRIITEEHVEVTARGSLHYQTAEDIEVNQESAKWYTAEEDLQFVVDAIGPGHVIHGTVTVEGDRNDDVWRMFVRGGKVIRQNAELKWPDLPPEDEVPQ